MTPSPAAAAGAPPIDRLGRLSEIFVSFQGEGPHVGKRQIFLRLAGCEVGCRFCDTPDALRGGAKYAVRAVPSTIASAGRVESIHDNPVAASIAAERVHGLAETFGPIHAVSITGGEPLEQVEFLDALLPRLQPLPVLLETAGCHPDALERVVRHVAIVSMDLKLPSVARIAPQWDAHERFLAIATATAAEVYVKVVVNPTLDAAEFDRAVAIVAARAPGIPFVIQPETDRRRVVTCGFDLLFDLAARANRGGLKDVRVLSQVHKHLTAP